MDNLVNYSRATLTGIAVSSGTALGRVLLIERENFRIPRYHINASLLEAEKQRLEKAISRSIQQIDNIIYSVQQYGAQPEQQALLMAHKMILQDDLFIGRIKRNIATQQINAEWAVSKAVNEVGLLFEHLESDYFRERRSDIAFIGKRLLRSLLGHSSDIPASMGEKAVVVAHDLSAIDVIQLAHKNVLAIVTALGGFTSHAAIITRSLGIPAVFGVSQIDRVAFDGQTIGVDGASGEVFLSPDAQVEKRLSAQVARLNEQREQLSEIKDLPAVTEDGQVIHLYGNIEFPDEVQQVNQNGGEGIGLYRTEYLFVDRQDAPTEDEHYQVYRRVLELSGGKEVTIRTIDLGFDKTFLAGSVSRVENNPALGVRAIRLCREYPDLLRNQLGGIFRAALYGPLKLLIPMVSGLEEIAWVRTMMSEVAADLQSRGLPYKADLPLGIMIEVPAAVTIADILAREVDFFSLGTNDLIQYSLAVDRSNETLASIYTPWHPAMLRMIDRTVKAAHNAGIPVSICGEMGAKAAFAIIFVALGINSISMNGSAIPEVKWALRHSSAEAVKHLWDELLELKSSEEITAYINAHLPALSVGMR